MSARKRIRLKVASPCKASWKDMSGDDAVRFCGLCKKNVYELSHMSSEQIEELLTGSGEKRCVRFYQRKDGTLLTSDCSVGLRRKRRKQAMVGAGVGVLSALGVAMGGGSPEAPPACEVPTEARPRPQVLPPPAQSLPELAAEPEGMPEFPDEEHEVIMGDWGGMEVEEDIDLDQLIDDVAEASED